MIRVIAGTHRGREVKAPRGLEVRPILARIRKSLFDILTLRIGDALFLDLYCGSGAVGIEALSRGARFAVFADASRDSLACARGNLDVLGMASRARDVRCDATGNLEFLSLAGGGKFDIIFMGPPYKDKEKNPLSLVAPTLSAINSSEILAPDGLVIAQHHKKENAAPPPPFCLYRQEKYGDSMLSFYRLNK
ncbi:MAG: 16S rRNA (guanine(966)-N(2))-methyltransferase RsmD [Elusimicrobia bacterium HGW-Elusimicrobia-1]|jgi:16S rRNA (guanine(966)-N(2))-methyltransferase RsmD|nr:MAG: 16S rRNA (guanine(966)-N(2))-methyltransferase RsmD [Elusimicrobia bacterium HGW-Elusimicrobia-1]